MQLLQQPHARVAEPSPNGYKAVTRAPYAICQKVGRPVHLVLHVRRFFCQESLCVRKIFAERFPSLTVPRVKFTLRLQEALREMGFELGGEAGARLSKKLSYPGSPDTMLRLVKRAELPPASAPRVVGLDDWSWKRRLRYGTLICDLESRKPLDVLADRSVETVSAWFVAHPSVEIVSRDRSSEYAAAIKKGAPQAIEVADRWHLGKNLTESLQTLLARCRAEIRRAWHVQAMPEQEREGTEPVLEEEKRPARSPREDQARLARRAQKLDRDAQVLELRDQGFRRLPLVLGLVYQDERCSDGWAMTPFQKLGGGAGDPASSIRMSGTSCNGGKRETAMAYNSTEN